MFDRPTLERYLLFKAVCILHASVAKHACLANF